MHSFNEQWNFKTIKEKKSLITALKLSQLNLFQESFPGFEFKLGSSDNNKSILYISSVENTVSSANTEHFELQVEKITEFTDAAEIRYKNIEKDYDVEKRNEKKFPKYDNQFGSEFSFDHRACITVRNQNSKTLTEYGDRLRENSSELSRKLPEMIFKLTALFQGIEKADCILTDVNMGLNIQVDDNDNLHLSNGASLCLRNALDGKSGPKVIQSIECTVPEIRNTGSGGNIEPTKALAFVLGCNIYKLCTGTLPQKSENFKEESRDIFNKKSIDLLYLDLINKLIDQRPEKRISLAEIEKELDTIKKQIVAPNNFLSNTAFSFDTPKMRTFPADKANSSPASHEKQVDNSKLEPNISEDKKLEIRKQDLHTIFSNELESFKSLRTTNFNNKLIDATSTDYDTEKRSRLFLIENKMYNCLKEEIRSLGFGDKDSKMTEYIESLKLSASYEGKGSNLELIKKMIEVKAGLQKENKFLKEQTEKNSLLGIFDNKGAKIKDFMLKIPIEQRSKLLCADDVEHGELFKLLAVHRSPFAKSQPNNDLTDFSTAARSFKEFANRFKEQLHERHTDKIQKLPPKDDTIPKPK